MNEKSNEKCIFDQLRGKNMRIIYQFKQAKDQIRKLNVREFFSRET